MVLILVLVNVVDAVIVSDTDTVNESTADTV
jgi:hypothetical protein